jgi:formylglycine-generating enzyme required for sulfatase activity
MRRKRRSGGIVSIRSMDQLSRTARPSRREFLAAAPAAALLAQAGQNPRAGASMRIGGIAFRWCPPGTFQMGSPSDEPGRRADEAQVRVTLTRGFWMGRTEVTQGEWRRICGAWPDRAPSSQFGEGDDYPMYWVNYSEAGMFCDRLTAEARRTGTLPDGLRVQLPTEAQWEYACRAGTTTATAFGPRVDRTQANIAVVSQRAGAGPLPANHGVPVGSYPPNGWGICDMYGNVFEWCRDWYHAQLPGGVDPFVDTPGAPNGDGSFSRVRRGGAWNDGPEFARSALRLRYEPDRRSDHIGFRVVCAAG